MGLVEKKGKRSARCVSHVIRGAPFSHLVCRNLKPRDFSRHRPYKYSEYMHHLQLLIAMKTESFDITGPVESLGIRALLKSTTML